jgi:ubiquinone/menaquinone biosynthesis C-methylase UbiE
LVLISLRQINGKAGIIMWPMDGKSGGKLLKVSDRLIELAGIRPGHRVLDIATGIGEPAISTAKIVGKNGHVTATDISTEMSAIAKERARSPGLNDIFT